jgi:mRNA interferase RelE/StbE
MGEMVTIPREEYERLLAVAEEAEDAAAVARFRARLAAGGEELVPAAVVDRLLAGEGPVRVAAAGTRRT